MELTDVLPLLSPISLCEMDKVKLMNRIDTKYILKLSLLPNVFEKVANHYMVLEIEGKRIFPYKTLYLDTQKDTMYNWHHNGKLNRYKIRFRKYLTSNHTFLEIKRKEKGTRTVKKRILVNEIEESLQAPSKLFIEEFSPFNSADLLAKIYTDFSRITLVNKNLTERVTIDTDITFYNKLQTEKKLENCVVIEVKQDSTNKSSKIAEVLQNFGIHPNGMSKYCIGRAMTEKSIKKNNFKARLINLKKISDGTACYRNI